MYAVELRQDFAERGHASWVLSEKLKTGLLCTLTPQSLNRTQLSG